MTELWKTTKSKT